LVGREDGVADGVAEGPAEGVGVGNREGADVGASVGTVDGAAVVGAFEQLVMKMSTHCAVLRVGLLTHSARHVTGHTLRAVAN